MELLSAAASLNPYSSRSVSVTMYFLLTLVVLYDANIPISISEAEMAIPHEVMFQNQLQFNMNIPLTTHNLATHFRHPRPITIERAAAAPSCKGFPMAQLANRHRGDPTGTQAGQHGDTAATDGFHFSALSQDTMAAAVQMAQRDMKNRKLQQKNKERMGRDGNRSPSPDPRRVQKPIPGAKYWEGQRSRVPKKPHWGSSAKGNKAPSAKAGRMDVREHDRNRAPRETGSQTPPSSPPRQAFLNTKVISGTSEHFKKKKNPEQGGWVVGVRRPVWSILSLTRTFMRGLRGT